MEYQLNIENYMLLIIFQNYFNTFWATMFLMTFMVIYLSYAQLAYTHKSRRYRNRNLDNPNYKPFVSVMIPAHNEANVIEKTIENVLRMDYDSFEVILIDDRSTDNTAEVLKLIEMPELHRYHQEFLLEAEQVDIQ